jgi:hypothetical protein
LGLFLPMFSGFFGFSADILRFFPPAISGALLAPKGVVSLLVAGYPRSSKGLPAVALAATCEIFADGS